MTDMATIKVTREVRDRVRDAAKAAHLTQAQLIEELLQQRQKDEFWAALDNETPDAEYLAAMNELDATFLPEADDAINRFEAQS